jgi:hypothetical protein
VITYTPGGTDYQVNEFDMETDRPFYCAADGGRLAVLTKREDGGGSEELIFTAGDPRNAPFAFEVVCSEDDKVDYPYCLAFDATTDTWTAVSTAEGDETCYAFHRTSGEVWNGPYIVAQQPGGNVFGRGIAHRPGDGKTLITVWEEESGTDTVAINVYAGTASTGSFPDVATITTYDITAVDIHGAIALPTATGDPAAIVLVKPVAQDTWDFDAYQPDGLGGWSHDFTWNSQLTQGFGWLLGFSCTTVPSDCLAITAIEHNETADNYGRVLVYYPW